MKKKILALCLVLALAVTAIGGATLAYFWDTDSDVNVMTTGNLKIYQNEQQRTIDSEIDNDKQFETIRETGDGLEDFENGKKLFPVDPSDFESFELVEINGNSTSMPKHDLFVDKIVSVTNFGSEQAYVRTLFLFEMLPVKDDQGKITGWKDAVIVNYENDINYLMDGNAPMVIRDNGKVYRVCVSYYPVSNPDGILPAGESTGPSLTGISLDNSVGNEFYDYFGGEYKMYVLSQAAQVEGFNDAAAAFEACFGADTVEKVTGWFSDMMN